MVASSCETLAHEPHFIHSECPITRGNTQMGRYLCLQTVVASLCGFEKKHEGNHEKNNLGNNEQCHFEKYFCAIFFFCVNYIGH